MASYSRLQLLRRARDPLAALRGTPAAIDIAHMFVRSASFYATGESVNRGQITPRVFQQRQSFHISPKRSILPPLPRKSCDSVLAPV